MSGSRRICFHCACDAACLSCLGARQDAVWVYVNEPGVNSSTLITGGCIACGGSGIRADHICARIEDQFRQVWQLERLRDFIEDATFSFPGMRTIHLNVDTTGRQGFGTSSVALEPRLRIFTDLPGSAVLHNWNFLPGPPSPTLHTLVEGTIRIESPDDEVFEDEIDPSWRGRLEEWLGRGRTALDRHGSVIFSRVVLGTG